MNEPRIFKAIDSEDFVAVFFVGKKPLPMTWHGPSAEKVRDAAVAWWTSENARLTKKAPVERIDNPIRVTGAETPEAKAAREKRDAEDAEREEEHYAQILNTPQPKMPWDL